MLPLLDVTLDIRSAADAGEIAPVNDFGTALSGGLSALLFGAGLLTFAYMLWGALDWILSQGDQGKVESARKKITQAVIGLVLLASTLAIFYVVQYVIGIEIIKQPARSAAPTYGICSPSCPSGFLCENGSCVKP